MIRNEEKRKSIEHGEQCQSIIELLRVQIRDHVDVCGSKHCDGSLGFSKMPYGYALMLNYDRTHYYWLRWDGLESCICWDRWDVYRGAKSNAVSY